MSKFDIRQIDLGKLNSMTKYPSILTYHALGEKGMLRDEVLVPFVPLAPGNSDSRLFATEKVDGTNARMIFCPDGSALLGSREDLLWERHDLIGNNVMGIIDILRTKVTELAVGWHPTAVRQPPFVTPIVAMFGEVYGKNVGGNAKQYSKSGASGFRLFDVAYIQNWWDILEWPREKIAGWRDGGGQSWLGVESLVRLADETNLSLVPALFEMSADQFPTRLDDILPFLLTFGDSHCCLDDTGLGEAEGIVVRDYARTKIAKLRREDYERVARKRKSEGRPPAPQTTAIS